MTFNASVVIPLYNKSQYIVRAITSVLSQEVPVSEIIVVDDGSTDDSLEKVKEIASDKVILITQHNQGVSCARNNGIKKSRSKYILFLDADDIWLPNFTKEISKLAYQYPNAGMLATAYAFKEIEKITPAKLKAVPKKQGLLNDYFLSCIKADLPITASSVAIKKSVILSVGGFPEGMAMGEDQLTWSRVAYLTQVAFSNIICVHYDRAVDNSACKINLITELAPHIMHWQQDLAEGKVPTHLKYSLTQLLHFSALYCIKNNLKSNNKKQAMNQLLNEPLLKKDRYWFAGVLLSLLPYFVIKRVL